MSDEKVADVDSIQDDTSAGQALLIGLRSAEKIFNGSDKLDDKLEAFRHIVAGVEGFLQRQPEFSKLINPVNQLHSLLQDLIDGYDSPYIPPALTGRPRKSNSKYGQILIAAFLSLAKEGGMSSDDASAVAADAANKHHIPEPGSSSRPPKPSSERWEALLKKLNSKEFSDKNGEEAAAFKTVRDSALRNSDNEPSRAAALLLENVIPILGGNLPPEVNGS